MGAYHIVVTGMLTPVLVTECIREDLNTDQIITMIPEARIKIKNT